MSILVFRSRSIGTRSVLRPLPKALLAGGTRFVLLHGLQRGGRIAFRGGCGWQPGWGWGGADTVLPVAPARAARGISEACVEGAWLASSLIRCWASEPIRCCASGLTCCCASGCLTTGGGSDGTTGALCCTGAAVGFVPAWLTGDQGRPVPCCLAPGCLRGLRFRLVEMEFYFEQRFGST